MQEIKLVPTIIEETRVGILGIRFDQDSAKRIFNSIFNFIFGKGYENFRKDKVIRNPDGSTTTTRYYNS